MAPSPILVLVQKRLQYLKLKVEGPLQAQLAAATPEAPGDNIATNMTNPKHTHSTYL